MKTGSILAQAVKQATHQDLSERNLEIYNRVKAGESPFQLNYEYKITAQQIYLIVKKIDKKLLEIEKQTG